MYKAYTYIRRDNADKVETFLRIKTSFPFPKFQDYGSMTACLLKPALYVLQCLNSEKSSSGGASRCQYYKTFYDRNLRIFAIS